MSKQESGRSQLQELRREWNKHPLIRVAGAYLVGAWLVLQVAETILSNYDVPETVMQLLIAGLVALFPVVLITARFTSISRLFEAQTSADHEIDAVPAAVTTDISSPVLRTLDLPVELSERRRVTTVVCSLTGLRGGRPDPEVALGIIPSLKDQVDPVIERYDGLRLASSRNQIIVAFGFPRLHEDDARRAAKAGQDILALLTEQDTTIPDTTLFASAGIHTDTIIVDDDDDDSDELTLLGDNTATVEWLRARAPRGGIAISADTARLLSGFFALTGISHDSHPNLGQDIPIYQLGDELSGQWQQIMGELSEFLGREHEYQLLLDKWQTVLDGETQVVFLKGEAGIGKSSLLYHTVREILVRDTPQLLLLNCESYYSNSPFRPITRHLEHTIFGDDLSLPQTERAQRLRQFVDGLELNQEKTLPLLASLLSIRSTDADMQLDESGRLIREKTLSCLVGMLQALARTSPVLLVVEDLHWADPSTIELLDHLLSDVPDYRIYGLFSARPEFESGWNNHSQAFTMHLGKLSDRVAESLVRQRFGKQAVPDWLVSHLVKESGGIPFYLDELVRSLLDAGGSLMNASPENLQIPPSLRASLDSRVDKLGNAKPLLQLCSVIGQEFPYDLLLQVVGSENEQALLGALGDLVSEGLLYQKGVAPEASFRFKHRLIMESAYQSLLIKTRGELHGAIAERLEATFPELCHSAPGRVAEHFEHAGNANKAIEYRVLAARRAYRSFSNDEALAHVCKGEESLAQLNEEQVRRTLEFALTNLKGMIWLASSGYTNPEVRAAFERAIELSEHLDNSEELFSTIVGMWMYYLIRAEYPEALELARRLHRMATATGSEPELLQANYGMGYSVYFGADRQLAVDYFQEAVNHDVPDQDYTRQTPSQDDSRVHAYCMQALSLWLTGDAGASKLAMEKAFNIAESANQPYARMWANYQCAFLCHMRGELQLMSEHAETMRGIAVQKGFSFFVPLAEFFRATLVEDPCERLDALRKNHTIIMSVGARSSTSYFSTIIIEQLIDQGSLEAAGALLGEVCDFIETRQELLFMPECLRLRARLLSASGDSPEQDLIENDLREAVNSAMKMQDRPFALRSALAFHDANPESEEPRILVGKILDSYQSVDDTAEFFRANQILNRDTF